MHKREDGDDKDAKRSVFLSISFRVFSFFHFSFERKKNTLQVNGGFFVTSGKTRNTQQQQIFILSRTHLANNTAGSAVHLVCCGGLLLLRASLRFSAVWRQRWGCVSRGGAVCHVVEVSNNIRVLLDENQGFYGLVELASIFTVKRF